jgi:DNA-binding XRE family transcriptional regulator
VQVAERRKELGLTQDHLARILGVSRQLVSLIETGTYRPYPKIKRRMSEVLGTPEEILFPSGGDEK